MDTTEARSVAIATENTIQRGLEALAACSQGGMHLLNALRFLGIEPLQIRTQEEAMSRVWPTPWAYDVWCAWHACRIALDRAEWPWPDIADDRRNDWRTSAHFVD